jgi:hypothetical protein
LLEVRHYPEESMNVIESFLVALLVGLGVGGYFGYEYRDGKVAQQIVKAENAVIERANKNAALETASAVALAEARAAARTKTDTARLKGELDAAKKARVGCSRDAESLGLLNASIALASGEEGATGIVSPEVRPAAGAGGRLGTVSGALGIRFGGLGWTVSPAPQRVQQVGDQ